jgi:hypothetical protein
VAQFVAAHIDSVFRLDIVLLLARQTPRAFTPEEVARELRLDPYGAAAELEAMASRGLLDEVREGATVKYKFEPAREDVRRVVRELATLYAQRPTTIVTLIYTRPSDKLRSFADAFKLRKD